MTKKSKSMNDSVRINAASGRSQDIVRVGEGGPTLPKVSHVLGVLSLIWSLIAWAEWFLIPFLYPHDGSPVPYLGFALQAIILLLGCVCVLILIPPLAIAVRRPWMLVYTIPAAAFVAFQVWCFVMEIFW